jgi:Zn-dependent metalloprotease
MQQSENDKKQEIIYRVLVKAKQGNDDKNIMYKIDSQGNKLFKRNTRQEIVYKTKLSGGEASSSSSANGGDESKIDTGSGYGGNMNVGSYEYDGNDTKLEIQVIDGMCTMLNDTRHVATVNLHQDENFSNYIPYAYLPKDRSCSLSMIDEVNGGFSPLNDAHYFGGVINDMYKKYGTYALNQIEEDDSGNTTTKQAQLVMRVHYGENYENAFWDGSSMTFGDGGDNFYPLVSLDLAAHEISHGFTSQHSGLEYVNQSGALNESFSDMAGITSKAYLKSEQPEASKKVYPNMMTSEDGSLSYSAKGCRTISTNGSCVLTITYSGLNKYSGKDVIVKLPSSYTSESKCPATNGNLQTCSFVVKAIGSTKQQQSAEILLGYEDNLIKSSFILGGSVE